MDSITAFGFRRHSPTTDDHFVLTAKQVFAGGGNRTVGAHPLPAEVTALDANDLSALHGSVRMRIPDLERLAGRPLRTWTLTPHGSHGGTWVFDGSVGLYPYDPEGAQVAWSFILDTLHAVVDAFEPDLLVVNGSAMGVTAFPPWEALPDAGTVLFGPLTYLSDAQLDETWRRLLPTLPAFRSEPWKKGWVVRAVDSICDSPHPALADAISRLPGHPEYHQTPCPPPRSR